MNLIRLRERLDWSRQELGDYLGVAYSTVAAWEIGTREPRPKVARKIIELAETNGIRMKLEDVYPRD